MPLTALNFNKNFFDFQKEQLAMLWILFVSIIFGNCSVLITLLFSKGRGNRFRYFIKHLAIADLSVGLVSVMTDIIWKFTVEWKAGNIACKVVKYSQVVVTYSSTYVLVALTIDRYDAIRHPMNFSKSWKRAKTLVLTAWLLSFLFSIPIMILYEEKYVEGHLQCWIDLLESWHWQMYMTLISITVFFIPACIIATCYSIIIYTIWSKTNILNQNKTNHHTFSEKSASFTEDTDCRRVSSRGLIPKAKIKTIKMTLIIVFVFIFCWSPYMIFDLLQVFGYIEQTQSNIALATFIQSLAPLNSAANPIIYCLFSTFMCRVQRKSLPALCFTRWCFNTHLGNSRKISDTDTYSNVMRATTKSYMNLRQSNTQKTSGCSKTIAPSEMTLRNHSNEMSERAKAFSVESLINTEQHGELKEEEILRGGNIPREDKVKKKVSNQLKTWNNITMELCSNDLWEKFSEIGTEMIVTKAGRRMFPTLKFRFHGLSLSTTYIVFMDIIPMGETRYRYIYHSSQWIAAGTSEGYSGNNTYVHPDSPATGQLWISQGHISFDKLKLTNNKKPVMAGQISLNSMHKYQPRIHILEVPVCDNIKLNSGSEILNYVHAHRDRAATFSFEQTVFITVTAYQNQEITKLKIQSNPFAKGFRETFKSREDIINKLPTHQLYVPRTLSDNEKHRTMELDWKKNSLEIPSWSGKAQKIPLKFVVPPANMEQK